MQPKCDIPHLNSSIRAYSRKLGQHSILARNSTFLKKVHQKLSPLSYSIPFLSVLYRNETLYNFCQRGQCSIVERNIGLEYALSMYFFL